LKFNGSSSYTPSFIIKRNIIRRGQVGVRSESERGRSESERGRSESEKGRSERGV